MNTKSKNKLSPQQKEAILQTIKNDLHFDQSILFVFAHGSFIEKELPFRDIDIAVYFDEEAGQKDLVDLCLEVSVKLSALVGMTVDVHALNASRIGFSYQATGGKLLYTVDEELSYDFMENIRMKYYDLKPFWKENLQDLLSSSQCDKTSPAPVDTQIQFFRLLMISFVNRSILRFLLIM